MALSQITANGLTSEPITAGTYNAPTITVGTDGRISGITNTTYPYIDSNNVILKTNTVITSNTTVASNTGGLTVGPMYVANNIVLTVAANARYVIL